MYTTVQSNDARVSRTTLAGTITRESRGMKQYAPLVCALLVGTGGYTTADYLTKRSDQGYRFILFKNAPGDVDIAAQTDVVRTSAENLTRIREILKPTITELANLFGVSRQAVYDWQAGKPTAPENAAKLDDLAKAADALAATGIDGSSQLLRRKIAGNKSLLDVVREGGSATSAAHVLAQAVVREAKQREQLASRLAGRAKPNVPHDDYGVPMLDDHS
jgi:transcriptional regulator with XRE-family HTH domain